MQILRPSSVMISSHVIPQCIVVSVKHYANRRVAQARGAQILGSRSPGRLKFVRWLLSMGLASFYPSGALNLEVASRFLDSLCIPGIGVVGGPSAEYTDIPV
jgi:hypothetical protein